ncbi:malonyl CoA-ACP transacylase [Mycolicibacterium flavescens]|uniref:Malonyl CoA-ACP transacylase n=1 Tax=Mycolicibacterium flavescens TaxID=1776 RepID=A0A1E3RMY3_MYCFV|nr:malonyl CoA-ACP transacylase [Mycolicibacterium flavescens]MCV7281839.1 malonyl CoA-ACP transacylase [Mycolicibacterium flavescens]ODQ90782.1 malonyl CoA-ACP transacylase [Mycolicibacterium flavescens]
MSVEVAATVAGVPVPIAEIDAREARLRASRIAPSLPRPGTSEGRQLRRWLTQLAVTERVLADEAATRGLTADGAPDEADLLPDMTVRMEIGSVAASVLADPLARAVYVDVTTAVEVTESQVASYQSRNPLRFNNCEAAEHLRAAARRREFRRWLDARCAAVVDLAPGYEHPGDPRQPDNTHRH